MRFGSRHELINKIEKEHAAFLELTKTVPRKRYCEADVWGDGWNLKDLFAHLTEWEQMSLVWYREGRNGGSPAVPAEGFKWNQTPALNRAVQQKHRRTSTKEIITDFNASYSEILCVARQISTKELFTPGYFAWTGKALLSTYLAANTCSHYRTATKYLKRWLRRQHDD